MSSHIRPSTTMQTLDPAGVSLEKKKKPLHEYPDVNIATELHAHIGVDSMRRNGLHTIDKDIVIAASGNLVLFINYQTGVITSLTGPTGGGVGAVTVHPSKNHFVVCEKAPENPRVVVYSYPEKKETHVMTKGAVVGFSTCAFNEAGNLLATVGIAPDFTLTIWDWKQEVTVLRNKAFSSDVYKVAFCPFNEGTLITSGMGHLKIWTMASTFTGLKLQGAIGKFGRVELSDVCGAVTFPSGKVLSGSEFGSLLLWEGNLVKYE